MEFTPFDPVEDAIEKSIETENRIKTANKYFLLGICAAVAIGVTIYAVITTIERRKKKGTDISH